MEGGRGEVEERGMEGGAWREGGREVEERGMEGGREGWREGGREGGGGAWREGRGEASKDRMEDVGVERGRVKGKVERWRG